MNHSLKELLARADSVGGDFGERIRRIVLRDARQKLYLTSTNLLLEQDKNGAFTPHGCHVCLGIEPGQNTEGIPTLGQHVCLDAWQNGLSESQIPREAMLNLWFCPNCRIPISKTTPKFE